MVPAGQLFPVTTRTTTVHHQRSDHTAPVSRERQCARHHPRRNCPRLGCPAAEKRSPSQCTRRKCSHECLHFRVFQRPAVVASEQQGRARDALRHSDQLVFRQIRRAAGLQHDVVRPVHAAVRIQPSAALWPPRPSTALEQGAEAQATLASARALPATLLYFTLSPLDSAFYPDVSSHARALTSQHQRCGVGQVLLHVWPHGREPLHS